MGFWLGLGMKDGFFFFFERLGLALTVVMESG